MLLIIFSFLILGLIISSIANDYAVEMKKESITKTSATISDFLVRDFDGYGSVEFYDYLTDEKDRLGADCIHRL